MSLEIYVTMTDSVTTVTMTDTVIKSACPKDAHCRKRSQSRCHTVSPDKLSQSLTVSPNLTVTVTKTVTKFACPEKHTFKEVSYDATLCHQICTITDTVTKSDSITDAQCHQTSLPRLLTLSSNLLVLKKHTVAKSDRDTDTGVYSDPDSQGILTL